MVRVLEVERPNAPSRRIPIRKPLGTGGGVLHVGGFEACIAPVHVSDDDGHVLKPPVIAARVQRGGSALGGEEFGEFQALVADGDLPAPGVR